MARPRVFISSTFYNLKEVRAALEAFVAQMGYDAVVTDNITYLPGQPLDESCYLEAGACDIFVLIVGGRYGSEISETDTQEEKEFYELYKSITRKEFESALERDVPIYVAVDRAVSVEYGTWDVNRDNETVRYRHVDSVNVFRLIEFIRNKTQTPVHEFEQSAEILEWLREQWSGLFQSLLSKRSDQTRLASLEEQISELRAVSATFKRYLETMLLDTEATAEKIIEEEDERLKEERLKANPYVKDWLSVGLSLEEIKRFFTEARSYEHLVELAQGVPEPIRPDRETVEYWRSSPRARRNFDLIREELGLEPLGFESTGDGRLANRGPG